MAAGEEILRVEGLVKSFFGVEVLHGVGFTLHTGEVLGLVGENTAGQSDRPGETGRCAGQLPDQCFIGHLQVVAAKVVAQLDFVELVIAAQQHCHLLFTLILQHQGLDHLLWVLIQERGNIFDALQVRRRDLAQLHGRCRCFSLRSTQLCLFDIGRVVTAVAGDDGVFTGFGEHHEFMGETTANRS